MEVKNYVAQIDAEAKILFGLILRGLHALALLERYDFGWLRLHVLGFVGVQIVLGHHDPTSRKGQENLF